MKFHLKRESFGIDCDHNIDFILFVIFYNGWEIETRAARKTIFFLGMQSKAVLPTDKKYIYKEPMRVKTTDSLKKFFCEKMRS